MAEKKTVTQKTYKVVVVVQSAGGTHTRTLLFDRQDAADKAVAQLATIIDETWGDS